MTTRTETQPVAHQPHHRHSPVATWWIGALAPDNWRGIGTVIRLAAFVLILACAAGPRF